MTIDFGPTAERDAAEISDFLLRMYPSNAGGLLLSDHHMQWKYWVPRSDWQGSRGFTARHKGVIVAHAAAWPVGVRIPGRVVPAVHLIDWAADPEYPGAGIWLMRQIAARVPLMIASGGSEMTRRILPIIGFRPHSDVGWFACPVRPLGQALTTARNWKLPARLLRNAFWRLSAPLSVPRGWSARVLAPREVPEALWAQASPTIAVTARDAALYTYFVDSRSARHDLFGLEKNGELVGYFCLAYAPHVARIADLWLPAMNVEDWSAAFRTAAVVALGEREVYEISAWASTALGKDALGRAGFRLRQRSPLSILGDTDMLDGRELHLQMLDCDASFLAGDAAFYLT